MSVQDGMLLSGLLLREALYVQQEKLNVGSRGLLK